MKIKTRNLQRRRPEKATQTGQAEPKNLLHQLIANWKSLSSAQQVVLIICILIVMGTVCGFLFPPTRHRKEEGRVEINGLMKTGIFKAKEAICRYLPLTKKPTSSYQPPQTSLSFLPNKEPGVKGTVVYAFEDYLHDNDPLKIKILRYKLRMLKECINKLELTDIQKAAIKGMQIRLADRQAVYGAMH